MIKVFVKVQKMMNSRPNRSGILSLLQSHTGRGTQCSQDCRGNRNDDLHNKLSRLFLTHIFLLSLLILGTVPKTEPAPKIKSPRLINYRPRDNRPQDLMG